MNDTNKRKKAPEWITWGNFLEDLPDACHGWLVDNGFDYLDHTDDALVLTWRADCTADTAKYAWDQVCALAAVRAPRPIDPIFDKGFRRIHLMPDKQWYSHPKFLDGRAWRAVRYATLVTQGNWCRACGRKPPAVELHVDHIKPRSQFPLLALDLDNLQVLCRDCNLGKGVKDQTDWRLPNPPPQELLP